MIKLMLVDDQDFFRQGLAKLLSRESGIEVIGQADNGEVAIALAEDLQPDVILMDVQMPVCNGITATQEIVQRYPWMRILVLTTFDDDEYIEKSLQAGAKGYLLKRKSSQEMATAIRASYEGYAQLSPEVSSKVLPKVSIVFKGESKSESLNMLNESETKILRLVGEGKNNQEISDCLYLSPNTIKNYVTRIMNKLKLRDRVAVAIWAKDNLV